MGEGPSDEGAVAQVRFIAAVHALGRIARLSPSDISPGRKKDDAYHAIKLCRDHAGVPKDDTLLQSALSIVEGRLRAEAAQNPALDPFVFACAGNGKDINTAVFHVACRLLSLDKEDFRAASLNLTGVYACYRRSIDGRVIVENMQVPGDESSLIANFCSWYKTKSSKVDVSGYILPIQKNYFFAGIMRGRRVPYLHFAIFVDTPEEVNYLHGSSLDTDHRGRVVASKYFCARLGEGDSAPETGIFDLNTFAGNVGEEKSNEILHMIGETALSVE